MMNGDDVVGRNPSELRGLCRKAQGFFRAIDGS